MKAAALIIVLFTAGCATFDADVVGAKDTWAGARYESVVSQWGTPVRSETMSDGRDVRTWVSEGAGGGSFYPSIGIFGGSGGVGVGTGVTMGPGGGQYARCERTLFFRDARVIDQLWQGNARFCSTFKRR